MGRALDIKYNPRSNRYEIPFRKRELGYCKELTLEAAYRRFEKEHGFLSPSEIASKASEVESLAEVLVEAEEEQEEANESEITLQKEDK